MTTSQAPFTVLIAPDSYKECMSAAKAAEIMVGAAGHGSAAWSAARYVNTPIADGGEGSLDALLKNSAGFERVDLIVPNAMGDPVEVGVGWNAKTSQAFVESAQALALGLIPEQERNVMHAHSFGLGMMITEALNLGAKDITIALGGSATNDGGAGMLSALGVHFYDRAGRELPPFPASLKNLAATDLRKLDPRLAKTNITLALDVDNPLLGRSGASAVFGPQKGASSEEVATLEEGLRKLARSTTAAQKFEAKTSGADASSIFDLCDAGGAGAAGGIGWAAMQVLGAKPESGFEVIARALNFQSLVEEADLVFTGEGRLDAQTLNGKAVMGVLDQATEKGVPVVIFAGSVGEGWEVCQDMPGVSVVVTTPSKQSIDAALEHCEENLRAAVEDYVRANELPI